MKKRKIRKRRNLLKLLFNKNKLRFSSQSKKLSLRLRLNRVKQLKKKKLRKLLNLNLKSPQHKQNNNPRKSLGLSSQ